MCEWQASPSSFRRALVMLDALSALNLNTCPVSNTYINMKVFRVIRGTRKEESVLQSVSALLIHNEVTLDDFEPGSDCAR